MLFRYGRSIGAVAIGLALAVWAQPILDPTPIFLAAVIVAAWFGGLGPGLMAAILALLAVEYYFTPPFHSFEPRLQQVPRLFVFAVLAVLSAWGSAARKKAEDSLREARDELDARVLQRTAELSRANDDLRRHASLLDLTHDTVFVRDMNDVITFWNRGAEEQYGWTRDEAHGHVTHDLMRTIFPLPLEQIKADFARTGRWEGELVQTRRDGTQIVVASRWALLLDPASRPVAILETNNDVTERKRAEQALEELAGRLIHAQEQERSRIGRELHDHISQMLGILTIKIDQLRADRALPPPVTGALDDLRHDTVAITDDVHRLSHRLHSSTLDYLGLVPALQKLVGEFAERHGIAIEFTHASLPAPLPSDVALCLFRVTEEALANVGKHSNARSARVRINGAEDGIHLMVEDAGDGFDMTRVEKGAGLGFVSMQERLRVLRGTVRVDSAPSRGTRVEVWVPAVSVEVASAGETADFSAG